MDITVAQCGWEDCESGHSFGPAVRGCYLIHFIRAGRGKLYAEGREWSLGAGDGFVIFPGEVTLYCADQKEPWQYAWIGYSGREAANLTRQTGFLGGRRTFHTEAVERTYRLLVDAYDDMRALRHGAQSAYGSLYQFMAIAAEDAARESDASAQREYYEKACWYMRGRMAHSVRIDETAAFVGLSRSQLFRVFRQECGRSPKETLDEMRLEQAKAYLQSTRFTVESIALSVGMNSAQQLCAAFRKRYGCTPGEMREKDPTK